MLQFFRKTWFYALACCCRGKTAYERHNLACRNQKLRRSPITSVAGATTKVLPTNSDENSFLGHWPLLPCSHLLFSPNLRNPRTGA